MDLFDAEMLASFETSVRDLNQSQLLPPACYSSDEWFEFEKDALFGHSWLGVGRASDIPEPGDFFNTELVGEPLLIVRQPDGAIKALSSVCQHRGMVVSESSGNQRTFMCPYHHWNYGLDGRLLGAPAMERAVGFDKAEHSLPEIQVEIWQGFIFVNFDPEAPPLAPSLVELDPFFEHVNLDTAITRWNDPKPNLPWNYKVMLENSNDGYHASRLHHALQGFAPSGNSDYFDWREGMGHVSRVNNMTTMDGSFNPTQKNLLPVWKEFNEDDRKRAVFMLIPPTTNVTIVADEVAFFMLNPHDAGHFDMISGFCFDPEGLENPMFEYLVKQAQQGLENFWPEDAYADREVQRGLKSRFAPRGRYSWQEETMLQMNKWLVERYRKYWPTSV